jgi:iron complex outermembrane receptor protein
MRTYVLIAAAAHAILIPLGSAYAQEVEPGAASAAEASAPRSNLDEIVVTARKRNESVQDVPISVAAVSGLAMQARGIQQFTDLPAVTSGFTVRKSTIGLVDFRIRGLGTGSGNDSFEQAVALFIDGSFASRQAEFSQPIFDVERVEIIKGTQAALLAKNTSLGAVSITTRKPGNDWSFDLNANYEFALSSHQISGGVDVPLTDNLSVRLSGQLDRQGGWVKNLVNGRDYGQTTSRAGRIVAVWKPVDGFDVTAMYQEFNNKLRGLPAEVVIDNLGGARNRAAVAGQLANFETRLNRKLIASDTLIGDSLDDTSGRRAVVTMNKAVGEYTLTSVSAYSSYDKYFLFDNDYGIGNYITDLPYASSNDQVSQELRITSPASDKFNFVAGVFGLIEDWHFDRVIISGSPGLTAAQPGGTVLTGSVEEHFRLRTKSVSGFGQANLELFDNFTLTAGLRGTHDDRRARFNRFTLVPGVLASFLYPTILPTSRSFSEKSLDGSLGAQYKPRRDMMFFGSFSRGTKGGSFLNSPTAPDFARYRPEQANTFEIGAKLGGGRNLLNLTLFHTKIKRFQQSIFNGTRFDITQADVISKGAELDAGVELLPDLRLTGSLTYARARLPDGTPTVNAPDWSGNAQIAYRHPVGNDLKFDVSGGLEYKDRVIYGTVAQTVGIGTSAVSTVFLPGKANTKFNARIGIARSDDSWQLAVIGRNLSNVRVVEFSNPVPFLNGAGVATPSVPRTIALQLTIHR